MSKTHPQIRFDSAKERRIVEAMLIELTLNVLNLQESIPTRSGPYVVTMEDYLKRTGRTRAYPWMIDDLLLTMAEFGYTATWDESAREFTLNPIPDVHQVQSQFLYCGQHAYKIPTELRA